MTGSDADPGNQRRQDDARAFYFLIAKVVLFLAIPLLATALAVYVML